MGPFVGSADADVAELAVDAQVTVPDLSTRSSRTRSWVSVSRLSPGKELGSGHRALTGSPGGGVIGGGAGGRIGRLRGSRGVAGYPKRVIDTRGSPAYVARWPTSKPERQ